MRPVSGKVQGLADRILGEGTRMATRAARAVLDDPRGQEVLATAVGAAQKGRKRLGEVQDRVLHAVGLPTKSDYEDVARSMARLKRKMRELTRQLEEEAAEEEAEASGGGEEGVASVSKSSTHR